MRNKKARAVWIGILVLYVFTVFAVIVIDIALHWGVIVGLKILAGIHILLVFGVVASLAAKRKRN